MSSFSSNRNYELMPTNSNTGTWGTKTNSNLSIVDLNFGGRLSVNVAGSGDVTLNTTQAENVYHVMSGVLTGSINYILPTEGAIYLLNNSSTGSFTITAKMSSGTGLIIPQGSTMAVFANPDTPAVVPAFTSNVIVDEQTYTTAGTPTWTKPTGLGANAMTFVQVWASGGSGGAGAYSGGGGGGAYKEAWFLTSTLGSTETVTVGAGGVAVSGTNANGNHGNSSSFGGWLTAYGGGAGTGSATAASGGASGGWFANTSLNSPDYPTGEGKGGSGTTASTLGYYQGGGGGYCNNTPNTSNGAGSVFAGGGGGGGGGSGSAKSGGSSTYGGAGGAGTTSGAASDGTQPGGGGGGSPSGSNSGKGGDGKVKVTTYNG